MTRTLIIAVPCWGAHFRRLFLGPVMRSHRAAIAALRDAFASTIHVRYVVQTDAPAAIAAALGDFELTLVPSPSRVANPMRAMAGAHAHAIAGARDLDRVALLNADMLVSIEAFVAIERRFRQGKRAVVAAAGRTLPGLWGAPQPLAARELLAWSMRRAHPITRSCFWDVGRCHLPWAIYFEENGAVVMRPFHLHPLAVLVDRALPFDGTIDLDLIDNYDHDEIHVVTDADELALAEVSHRSKSLAATPWPMDVGQVVGWALRGARPMHWWNFRHRIAVAGDPQRVEIDRTVADDVLRLCPYAEALDAAA